MSSAGVHVGDNTESITNNTALRIDEASLNNRHKIYQTDEAITVVCNEAPTQMMAHHSDIENSLSPVNKNKCNDDNNYHTDANESVVKIITSGDASIMKINSEVTSFRNDAAKHSWRKKTVSFENDENITKFISGEEIVDKRNPFRSMAQDIPDIRKTSKLKKSGIPTRSPPIITKAVIITDETDFISKEDILKQSKYVPVYIKNPDRVLTYDKSVLENFTKQTTKPQTVKRAPVPIPRKIVKKPKDRKKVKTHGKYPDLSDIKVKVGTDLDESLYDPNEVVLNVKKFDSLFKNTKFNSIDDIDKIADASDAESQVTDSQSQPSDKIDDDDKKSYTNTVNSKEFREYLKKKGLLLFPTKPTASPRETKPVTIDRNLSIESNASFDDLDNSISDVNQTDRKKTVFGRLSSIFTKKKTSPKSLDVTPKLSFVQNNEENHGSVMKRVVLERKNSADNRPVLANNEFVTSRNFLGNVATQSNNKIEENFKPILRNSMRAGDVSGGADVPQLIRRNRVENTSQYRNIDLNRSKLYQTTNGTQSKRIPSNPPSFDSVQLGDDVVRPRVYAPLVMRNSQSALKPPDAFERSSKTYKSLPLGNISKHKASVLSTHDPMRYNNNNYHDNNIEKIPVKSHETFSNTLPLQRASTNGQKNSGIDPFTFAKIHEIKRKTDEVLWNKSLRDENDEKRTSLKLNNQNFVRNSQQRSTITDCYARENNYGYPNSLQMTSNSSNQPPRSQSVLDNMTCYENSLYGEVTYRQPNSSQDVSVIMRRPSSSTLDKKQVMQKIYEYYRKSVDNSPVPFEKKNYHLKPKSGMSPKVLLAKNSSAAGEESLSPRAYRFYGTTGRKPMVSESDSEFAPESISSRDNYSRYFNAVQDRSTPVKLPNYQNHSIDEQRIYDVVDSSPRSELRNSMQRSQRLPATPEYVRPSVLLNRGDLIYNNQIYRPISTLKKEVSSPRNETMSSEGSYRQLPMKKKELRTPESDGEVQLIMQNRYFGK